MLHTVSGCTALMVVLVAIPMTRNNFMSEAYSPVLVAFSPAIGTKWSNDRHSTKLFLKKGWFADGDDEDEDSLVTREDLNRDLLGMEPEVKRKRKNGKGQGYTPLDNRDHLPFSVSIKTPDDPYKTEFQKRKEQQMMKKNNTSRRKATDLDRHMLASTRRGSATEKDKKNINSKKKHSNDSTTPSRLIQRQTKTKNRNHDGKSTMTVLGEFQLDKSTTSGDIIVVGDKEYLVESARCQYKYAGGQRFVMVRKVLEVKELNRAKKEDDLLRQYNSSPSSFSPSTSYEFE